MTDAFRNRIVSEGSDTKYGARPMRRTVQRHLEDTLAEAILSGYIADGDSPTVDVGSSRFSVLVRNGGKKYELDIPSDSGGIEDADDGGDVPPTDAWDTGAWQDATEAGVAS